MGNLSGASLVLSEIINEPTILDGKALARHLREQLSRDVQMLNAAHSLTPGLAVVLVGDDPASQVYVRNKTRQCEAVGMVSFQHTLPVTTSERDLLKLINQLNEKRDVHGILVQLPLPKQINPQKIINAIDPDKDVDGLHPMNAGRLSAGMPGFVSCTPMGCMKLIEHYVGGTDVLSGKKAVVLGRSNLVGKPVAALLLQHDCTVTIVHSKSTNIDRECEQADILIAAVGQPEMVRADWVKNGAIVIDVGINRIAMPDGKDVLVGDVTYNEVFPKVQAITPVPGGVGPMTIACLLLNTYQAACRAVG